MGGAKERREAIMNWSNAVQSEADAAVQLLEQAQQHLVDGEANPLQALHAKVELAKFISEKEDAQCLKVPESKAFLLTAKVEGMAAMDELLHVLAETPASLEAVRKSLDKVKKSSGVIFGHESLTQLLQRAFPKECNKGLDVTEW